MKTSNYTIYNASAGSGKTYTLTKAYLELLLKADHPQAFKSILAVTFTNKAVSEMKQRIVTMLRLFSNDMENEKHPMLLDICYALQLSEAEIKQKSHSILKHLIHNYSAFNISTIDGFNHRLIRTFAHDLGVPVNFEVEMDLDTLRSKAVDQLIARIGHDDTLTNVLVDFALQKTDDDKSWNIGLDLNKIAELTTQDIHLEPLNDLKDKTLKDFDALAKHLTFKIKHLKQDLNDISHKALTCIETSGAVFTDFTGGSKAYLPNYFKKLNNGNFKIEFTSDWMLHIEGQPLYPTSRKDTVKAILDNIKPQLVEAFAMSKHKVIALNFHNALLKHLTPLSVLNAITKEINTLKASENKLLISEFNTLISNEIKDQPTPFIYERLGEKYNHYFIDEFQDTSTLQWQNLIPLLHNTLSATNGSVMLVGDAKQSIYRWRGGDPKQFINLSNQKKNPFYTTPQIKCLDTNYRSYKAVISFNNKLFSFLSQHYFSNKDYQGLFAEASQNTNNLNEGCVKLSFLDLANEKNPSEVYCQSVLESVISYQAHNYPLSSICVLVRKKAQGVAVANILNAHNIPITSNETLQLINAESVCFINNFLAYLIQPNDKNIAIECLTFIAMLNHVEDLHDFYKTHLKANQADCFESLKTLDIHINKASVFHLPLYELVEAIIRVFKLQHNADAYLQFYLDVVLEFTEKHNADIGSFLDYFENKKDKLSIVSPKNVEAVTIMTIHKSKGLEFPVVIFPFADVNIYYEKEPKVWFPVKEEKYNGFSKLLISYDKNVKTYHEEGDFIFQKKQSQLELDNINIMYVALTRAVQQLHIISKKDINAKGVVNEKTYAGMLIRFLKHENLWQDSQLDYHFGILSDNKDGIEISVNTEPIGFTSISKETHQLHILTNGGLLWDTKQAKAIERGNLIHLILSKIKTLADFEAAFQSLLDSGDLNHDRTIGLKSTIASVIHHPDLEVYFNDDFTIHTERNILSKNGTLLRPDRININAENEAIIIDYKTGDKQPSHANQLRSYEAELQNMGISTKTKILVYINDDVTVETLRR